MAEATTRTRTGFAPVVVLGLAAAGLAAVAGNKPWAVTRARADFVPGGALQQTADRFPLAGAVALLLLATWGVVLVTRGWMRRVRDGARGGGGGSACWPAACSARPWSASRSPPAVPPRRT